MSKQRPTPDRITNELAGASAFFKPSAPLPEPPNDPVPAVNRESTPEPKPVARVISAPETDTRTPRTPERPSRRQMIRHPFELYMDQLDSLRELAEFQRRRGEPASMSRMVREAIDRYLDEHPVDE